mmetsp:Transcript_30013/g.69889  ORF Transcript_30013/g.69889 Transcript_30013/m.69889 type:complete len:1307 (-) Transcript_30013:114-4034(-)
MHGEKEPKPILARGSSRLSNGSNVTFRDSVTDITPTERKTIQKGTSFEQWSSAPASQVGGPSGVPSIQHDDAESDYQPLSEIPEPQKRTMFGRMQAVTGIFPSIVDSAIHDTADHQPRGGTQMQRSHFKWLQKVDDSRGLDMSESHRGAITPAELASKYGVPGERVAAYLRQEIAESDACCSLPFTLVMVIAYSFAIILHDPGVGPNAVEHSIGNVIENSVYFHLTAPHVGHKGLDEINTHSDFWSWMVHGFIPRMFEDEEARRAERPKGEEIDWLEADDGMLLHYNRIVGGIRFLQEVSSDPCSGPDDMLAFRGTDCVGGYGYELLPEMWTAFITTDPEREWWLWTVDGLPKIFDEVYTKETTNWLDPATRKIEIAVPVFNAEHQVYSLIFVNFWFSRGGRIWSRVLPMSTYSNWWRGPLNVVADTVWLTCMVWITVTETMRIRVIYRLGGFRQLRVDYVSVWTIIDWVSVIISIALIILFVLRLSETSSLNSQLSTIAATEATTDTYRQLVQAFVIALDAEVHRTYEMRVFMGVYPALNIVRLFKAFAAQPRLAIVTRTLSASSVDLFHFLLVFLSVFVTYAISGTVLFGREVDAMTTLTRAMTTLFRACAIANFEYEDWQTVGRHEAGFFFVTFMAIMTMLMLNMLLAIVMGTYSEQKARLGAADTLMQEAAQAYTRWRLVRRGTHLRFREILRSLTLHLVGGAMAGHTGHSHDALYTIDPQGASKRGILKRNGSNQSLGSSQASVLSAEDPFQLITVDLLKSVCPGLQTEQSMAILEATIVQILEEDMVHENTAEMLREMRKVDVAMRRLRKKVDTVNEGQGGRRNSLVSIVEDGDSTTNSSKFAGKPQTMQQFIAAQTGSKDPTADISVFTDVLQFSQRRLASFKTWLGDNLVQSGYAQGSVVGPLPDMTIADQPFQSLDELPDWGVAKVLDKEESVLNACRLAGIGKEFDGRRLQLLGRVVRVLQKDVEDNTVKCRAAGVEDVWMALGSLAPVPQPGVEQRYVELLPTATVPVMGAEGSNRSNRSGQSGPFQIMDKGDTPPSPQLSSALAPSEENVKRAAELGQELKVGKHTVTEAMKALQELQWRQWKEQEEKAKVAMKFQQLKKKVVSLTKEHRRMQDELRRLDERIAVVGTSKDEYMDLVHTLLDENSRLREKLEEELGGRYANSKGESSSSSQPHRLAIEMPLRHRYQPAEAYTPTETTESQTPQAGNGNNGFLSDYGTLMERVQRLAAGLSSGEEVQRGPPPAPGAGRVDSSGTVSPNRLVQELGQLRDEVAHGYRERSRDRLGGTLHRSPDRRR